MIMRKVFIFITVFLLCIVIIGCGAQTSQTGSGNGSSQEVVIKLVSAWPEGDLDNVGLDLLEEKVAELGQGIIRIERAGGPETVPPLELGEAVRSGAVDMAWLHPAYYATSLPEGSVFDYSDYSFGELLASGAVDKMNEIHHEKMNVHIIGSGDNGLGYSIYTTTPVRSISDFEGKRIRVSSSYLPFLRALKAETVTMPTGEIYGALERGVIEGFTSPSIGIRARKLDEITKYKILPFYWRVVTLSIMNLDKWNSLSQEAKDVLMEASRQVEEELPAIAEELKKEEDEHLQQRGIEFVTIQEADEYLQLAREAGKQWVRESVKDEAEQLIELFFK